MSLKTNIHKLQNFGDDRYRLLANAVVGIRDYAIFNQSALLTVEDLGTGIASNKLGKIFDRYERGVESTGVSGLGIGLFVSKTIVESHNGTISVESRPQEEE